MVRTLKIQLRGYQIEARDGVLGHVTDAYFDDDRWAIRYLVVKTGDWLDAREVVLSPSALGEFHWDTRTITTRLTKDQVEHSPSIELHKPVSGQRSDDDYGGRPYWAPQPWADNRERVAPEDADPHLRSCRELVGYHIHAIGGRLGHVEDFVVDDENWTIRYLAVETSDWWFRGHVLVSPRWIAAVSWDQRAVHLRVTKEIVKHSPKWKPSYPITPEYEARLMEYYRRRITWSDDLRSNESPLGPP